MIKVIAKNKEASYNFSLEKKYIAGIKLKGWEVKSIRNNKVNLKGSFCFFKKNELFVSNMHINLYMNVSGDEVAARKLLLHKSELRRIKNFIEQKRISVVPTMLFWTEKSYIKLEIAIGTGKTKFDKRETIKKRDIERETRKNIRGWNGFDR